VGANPFPLLITTALGTPIPVPTVMFVCFGRVSGGYMVPVWFGCAGNVATLFVGGLFGALRCL